MTNEEQRIAIAEACGWREVHNNYDHAEFFPGGIIAGKFGNKEYVQEIPDYLNDLNAMHEAEKLLIPGQISKYYSELGYAVRKAERYFAWPEVHATARQRAEAFLKTKGLWKE